MTTRLAFIYFVKDRPARMREVLPYHVDYWRDVGVERYLGGPFADRSGGLISFGASSLGQAAAIVDQDPLVVHSLLTEGWIKEWMAQSVEPVQEARPLRPGRRGEDEMQGPREGDVLQGRRFGERRDRKEQS